MKCTFGIKGKKEEKTKTNNTFWRKNMSKYWPALHPKNCVYILSQLCRKGKIKVFQKGQTVQFLSLHLQDTVQKLFLSINVMLSFLIYFFFHILKTALLFKLLFSKVSCSARINKWAPFQFSCCMHFIKLWKHFEISAV